MNDFGKRLKLLREQRGLSLSQLGEAIGNTKSALSRYENGIVEPGLKTLIKLAEYFDVTLDWMAGNGDINNIQHATKSDYDETLDRCIKADVSPEKLNQIIDLFIK